LKRDGGGRVGGKTHLKTKGGIYPKKEGRYAFQGMRERGRKNGANENLGVPLEGISVEKKSARVKKGAGFGKTFEGKKAG